MAMTDKVVVMTDSLLDLLGVLKLTAEKKGESPEINGVRLYSTRGEYGEEPGQVDLLAGTSTDLKIAGHHFVPVEGGDIKDGIFLPMSDLETLEKKLGTIDDEEHVTEIIVDSVADTVTVREYDNPDGFKYTFQIPDRSDYPDAAIEKWVEGTSAPLTDDMGQTLDDGPVLVLDSVAVGILLKVARKLKVKAIPLHAGHRAAVYPVSLGDTWRGAVLPEESVAVLDKDGLEADYYLP